MILLVLLSISCPAPDVRCGPDGPSEAWCPIDGCAMGCSSVEEASRCCLDAHGRGVDGLALEQLLAECSGEACDPEQYISAGAALCLAQANGLASGVGWCGAGLVYNGESDVQWLVRNTTVDGCAAGEPFVEGDSVALDARDGSLLATGTVSAVVECPAGGE